MHGGAVPDGVGTDLFLFDSRLLFFRSDCVFVDDVSDAKSGESHTFAVEGKDIEFDEVLGFDQLREDVKAIVGRIGCLIGSLTVVIYELH